MEETKKQHITGICINAKLVIHSVKQRYNSLTFRALPI